MPFGLITRLDLGNHVLDGVQIPVGKGNFDEGKGETAESINLPFGRRKHKFNRIRKVVPMYPMTACRELCING